MGWLARAGLFTSGLFMVLVASRQLERGQVVFANASYHQTTFAAGGLGVGAFVMALAFLPPTAWVYRHITTLKPDCGLRRRLSRSQKRRAVRRK